MANQKQRTKEASSDAKIIAKAKKLTAGWSPEIRGYVGLGIGLFLFLFSIGYFEFLKVAIGILGFALIIWGTIRSKLISKITEWFDKITDKF